MSAIWFTSDLHFGHDAVIRYGRRPWTNVDEMNEALIERWNAIVSEKDTVYVLGDVAFLKPPAISATLSRLKGHKYLVEGNHDKRMPAHVREKHFGWTQKIAEIKIDKQLVVMCHYPMITWNRAHYGTWHLHGHSHGNLAVLPNARRMDVGIDCHPHHQPFSWDEIKSYMAQKTFESVDHHTQKT